MKQQKPPNRLSERLILSDQQAHHFVALKDLIRVKGNGSYCQFVLTTEQITTSKRLGLYVDYLAKRGFIRTHQSHMINPAHICKFKKSDGGALLMSNGDHIPVSHRLYNYVLKTLGLTA